MSFKDTVIRHAYDASNSLSKHAPALALGAGILGFVGTAVLASRSTLKMAPKVEEHKNDLLELKRVEAEAEHIAKKFDSGYTPDAPQYRKEAYVKWARFVGECAQVYAAPIIIGTCSVGLIMTSYRIQSNAILGLTMAYEGLKATFDKYREAVIEDHGEDADTKYIAYAHREVSEELQSRLDDHEVFHVDNRFVFGTETSSDFNGKASMWNVNFLNDVEAAMNRKLDYKGIVFLNEVLDALGMDRTPAGQQLGWVKGRDDSDHAGIDFGWRTLSDEITMHNMKNADSSDSAPEILLDFNYDGVVWDRL